MSDNPDTIDTILDDMLNEGHTGPADELEWVQAKMKFYADRIKAAWKRQCSQSWHHREMEELILRHEKEVNELKKQQIGNAAAMREALEYIVKVGYPHNFQHEAPHISGYCYEITDAITKCFEALAATPRNCDVGDAADWENRFGEECDKGHTCSDCPVRHAKTRMAIELQKGARCEFIWAQMPYEKEGGAE